jgi:hypothetical protein
VAMQALTWVGEAGKRRRRTKERTMILWLG